MQKKFLIFVLVLLPLVIIGAIIIFTAKQKQNKTSVKPEIKTTVEEKKFLNHIEGGSCDSISDEIKKKECFDKLNKAMNTTSDNACDNLASEQDKMVCQRAAFISEAVKSGDLAKCDEISNENNKAICISQVSLNLAISKKDKKYCDYMIYPNDKIDCLKILDGMNAISTTTPSGPNVNINSANN